MKPTTLAVTDEQKEQVDAVLAEIPSIGLEGAFELLTKGRRDENGAWREGVGIAEPLARIVLFMSTYPYESQEDQDTKMSLYSMVMNDLSPSDMEFLMFLCHQGAEFARMVSEEVSESKSSTIH